MGPESKRVLISPGRADQYSYRSQLERFLLLRVRPQSASIQDNSVGPALTPGTSRARGQHHRSGCSSRWQTCRAPHDDADHLVRPPRRRWRLRGNVPRRPGRSRPRTRDAPGVEPGRCAASLFASTTQNRLPTLRDFRSVGTTLMVVRKLFRLLVGTEWPESSAFHSFSTVAFPAIPAPAKPNGSLY